MRRITFSLMALFVVALVSAQSLNSRMTVSNNRLSHSQALAQRNLPPVQVLKNGNSKMFSLPKAFAATSTDTVIKSTPAGSLKMYYGSTHSFYNSWFGVIESNADGFIAKAVFGDNNTVFFRNIITELGAGTWIKGTQKSDTISFPVRQPVYKQGAYTYYMYSYKLTTYMQDSQEVTTYVVDSAATDIKFAVRNDSIVLLGDNQIGLGDSIGQWTGYGNMYTTYSVCNDKPVVAPSGLTTETYSLQYHPTDTTTMGRLVQVGIDGHDIYVKGISDNLPDAYAKGTIVGNKAVFIGDQLLGADESDGYYAYFVIAVR